MADEIPAWPQNEDRPEKPHDGCHACRLAENMDEKTLETFPLLLVQTIAAIGNQYGQWARADAKLRRHLAKRILHIASGIAHP